MLIALPLPNWICKIHPSRFDFTIHKAEARCIFNREIRHTMENISNWSWMAGQHYFKGMFAAMQIFGEGEEVRSIRVEACE
jgi:hypothetical protein